MLCTSARGESREQNNRGDEEVEDLVTSKLKESQVGGQLGKAATRDPS